MFYDDIHVSFLEMPRVDVDGLAASVNVCRLIFCSSPVLSVTATSSRASSVASDASQGARGEELDAGVARVFGSRQLRMLTPETRFSLLTILFVVSIEVI